MDIAGLLLPIYSPYNKKYIPSVLIIIVKPNFGVDEGGSFGEVRNPKKILFLCNTSKCDI
jgi:hypothetical protein